MPAEWNLQIGFTLRGQKQAMNLLVAEGLNKSYGTTELFENLCFGINEGDKCGLIGINGTGKSTLLKILAGLEEPDSGTITTRNGLKIAYLPQLPEYDDSLTLLENVIAGKTHEDAYRNLEGEARADLKRLGITDADVRPSTLSGGQRKRAALVRTLLTDSDLLILDEPTNHLDAEMTEWLEETLKAYRGAFICITHDRYFLDEVTNKIFELDKKALYSYQANYSRFVELKAEREEMQVATERKAATLYRQELAWMLRGARARSTKQKAHIERFKALRDRRKPEFDSQVSISSAYSRMGRKTLEAQHLRKCYGERAVVGDFSYIFLQGERIGIIGPNGCGKSTLLKMLTGNIEPDGGSVEYGTTVKFGYFAQECEFEDTSERVIDYVRDTAEVIHTKEGTITASRMCERFLFNADKQYAPIGKLSGGEKRRLYLLKVLMEAPNILILDEPTNDLDITTLTILEDYLQGFEGIVIAVSHDRYFLDKLVNRLFVFRGDGVIEQVEGNYTDFKEKELEKNAAAADAGGKFKNSDAGRTGVNCKTGSGSRAGESGKTGSGSLAGTGGKTGSGSLAGECTGADEDTGTGQGAKTWVGPAVVKLKMTYKEQKEFETIDEDIAGREAKIADLEREIAASVSNYSRLSELMALKDAAEAELEEKMERWVYLNDLAEKIKQQ